MKYIALTVFTITFSLTVQAQERPKLVVGIVVDQMKEDYLYRFNKHYTEGGFKRMMRDGAELKNMHYNYVPTNTGPGHASIYTGTTPALHGIISNNWYSKEEESSVYCVGDRSVKTVGSDTDEGQASPHRLLTTTITDELRLSTNGEGKVVSVSIKDRGAILPGGHTGQSYWFDYKRGDFVTSTFYRKDLPKWVKDFNKKKLSDKYSNSTWDRLLPEEAYFQDSPRQAEYERGFLGKEGTDFPYVLKDYRDNYNYGLVATTPFGNDLVVELAKSAIEGEELGQDDIVDFLAVSFSSTDIAGHNFGPQSQEIQDIYYRLDRNLEGFLNFLDEQVGEGNYLVFLTADHAVADVPLYLQHQKIPAGVFQLGNVEKRIDSLLNANYGVSGLVENISNYQLFLNYDKLLTNKLDPKELQQKIVDYVVDTETYVAYAWPAYMIHAADFGGEGIKGLLTRGYHQKRSGDVLMVPYPGWFASGSTKGTTHGSPFTYDTHVPMLWYGWNVPKIKSVKPYEISDIAATLSMMLNIRMPNGCIGSPITELFGK